MVQTYQPTCIPEIIAAKTGEFWSQLKRYPQESVDNYYNHFHDLLDDLLEAEEPVSTKSAIRHFIFTLGSEFECIQNNYRIGNLPAEWNTQDWPTLLVLCCNYSNSVNSQALLKQESPKPPGTTGISSHDRANHHKKIRQWFLNPTKFKNELETEQKKCAGKCIYHLTDSHTTEDCNVKKECDKFLSAKKSTNSIATTGQLCQNTEELSQDEIDDDAGNVSNEDIHNDTNEEI